MNFLLIHSVNFHYELIPSMISTFASRGNLDIIMSIQGYPLSEPLQSWIKIYDKIGLPYEIVSQVKENYYDYIIFDCEDIDEDWHLLQQRCMSYKDRLLNHTTKVFVIHHNIERNRAKQYCFDDKIKMVHMVIPELGLVSEGCQGLKFDRSMIFYWAVPYIEAEMKFQMISKSNECNVAILGDLIHKDPNFFSTLQKTISNFSSVKFHIMNRYFNPKVILEASTLSNVKLYTNIPAPTMLSILYMCDYLYYFNPNNIDEPTGSHQMAYSTLCKYICAPSVAYNHQFEHCLIIDPPIILNKITEEELTDIYIECYMMRDRTNQYITYKL